MINNRFLFLCIVIVILSGCAVSGPKYAEHSKSIAPLASDKGRIYFFRDDSFVGGAVRPDILLNGKAVGESLPGGYFLIDKEPGNHTVSTSTEVDRTVEFVLASGETKYIKTSVSMGFFVGHVIPELVGETDALKAMKELTFAGYYDPSKPRPKPAAGEEY